MGLNRALPVLLVLLILPALVYADIRVITLSKDLWLAFIFAVPITIILELAVAALFLSKMKIQNKVLIAVLLGNIISLPIVWYVFPLGFDKINSWMGYSDFWLVFPLMKSNASMVFISEVFAVIFESGLIFWLNRKLITLKHSFVMSLIMNVVSFFIGGYVFVFLWMAFWRGIAPP